MVCPPDEILRSFLSGETDQVTSTETVLHLVQCVPCRDLIVSWNEKPRLEQILRTLADGSGIGSPLPGATRHGQPAYDETKIYPNAPLRRIGHYDLLRSIGRGGGGEVFEAMHVRLRRRLAVKILGKKDTDDETVRKRFFREMESIGQLNHPHIVHAHDAGEADGTLYLAMELVDGENVELLARRVGPLPVAEACEIVRQAALGLQHIHQNGLVHRDLKPSNLLTSNAGVKIADLGLALLHRENSSDDQLTGNHTILGTADYIAPEQTEKSHHVDIRADIYSLGCTLFRLLAGHPPFASPENNTPMKKMWAHQAHPIPDIQRFRSDVPPNLAALINKLMAKDPNQRFAEPCELADALFPYCQESDVPSLILPGLAGSAPTGRSATDRDSGNGSKTPSLSSQPTVVNSSTVQVKRLSPGIIGISILVASLLASVAFLQLKPPRLATDSHKPGLGAIPDVQVGITTESPAQAHRETPLEPIAALWKKGLNQVPIDLLWGRPMDVGSARIDEGIGALVVQSRASLRLAQFGELKAGGPGMKLKFNLHSPSQRGLIGFFFGLRKDQSNPPQFIEFQAITVAWTSNTEVPETVAVRRSFEKYTLKRGDPISRRNRHVLLTLPISSESRSFEVQIEEDSLKDLKFSGLSCRELCVDEQNLYYRPQDYEGPFGVFVYDTSGWFTNPHLEWARHED